MDKLKELMETGWIVSACYESNEFYFVASYGALDVTMSASHADLEMAVIELYEKCMVTE